MPNFAETERQMPEEKKNKDWIWTTLTLVVLIGGFFIFRKSMQLSREDSFYAYYSEVKGLQASSPVRLKGVTIGKISDVTLDDNQQVKVTITINKETRLPIGTVALLASGGLLGEKIIKIVPGTGPGYIENGSAIPTAFDTSVMQTSVRVRPYLDVFKSTLHVTDSTLYAINKLVRQGILSPAISSIISFEKAMKKYAKISDTLNKKADNIIRVTSNINATANEIANNIESTKESIRNTEQETAEMANTRYDVRIRELRSVVKDIQQNITKLSSKDSGMGELISNKTTYKKAAETTEDINTESKELKENPPGFSIIGK